MADVSAFFMADGGNTGSTVYFILFYLFVYFSFVLFYFVFILLFCLFYFILCDEEYIGESSRTFRERFIEYLKAPSPIFDHSNITGHNTTLENFSIVGGDRGL